MSDLNTEIKLTASADGVETGVARAKRSLADLGATAAKTGSDGGKGMAPIGDGAEAAARKVDSATRSMQNSLQRQIAALEAGGTATRQYQESLAKLRGVDANAIKPLLDQLDAAKRKADGAGQGLLGLGSASSLLQGQLAALAGSLTLGSMAAFVLQINNGIDALNDIKDATGSTIENISALEDVGKRTGASLDLVGGILIKFNDVLSKAGPKSDIALQLQAIGLSAEELKRLDPAEALLRTAQALQQYADDGNKARLVQDLFGKSVKDAAPFLNDLAAKGELVAKVTSQQAEEAEKFNKELFAMQANIQDASRRLAGPLVTAINEVAEAFRKGSAEGKGFWENASDRYWSNVRGFYGMQQPGSRGVSGTITNAPGYTDAPVPTDRPSVGPVRTAADIAAAEAAARAAAQRAAEARKRELAEQAKFYADLSGLSADYYDKLATAQKQRAAGNISEAQYVEYVEQLIQKQPFATALTRDNAAALKAQTTAAIEAAKASAAYYGAIGQDLTRLDEQNERLRQEGEQIGLTAEGLLALTLARQDHAIAIESERLSLLQANEGSAEEIILQQRRIALLKEQRTLTATNGQRQIAADAAKAAASEWERASQQIEQSLTDALMRGFESGKGFAEVLRDTVVNMFKTMVLRPIVSAVVNPVAGAITGGLGLAGTANAATGGTSALGTLGSLASVSSAFGAGGAAGFGALMGGGFTEAVSAGFTTLLTGGSVGTAAAGLGTLAGALGPIALGIGALASLIGSTGGESRVGGQYGFNFGDGLTNNRRGTQVQGAVLGVNRLEGAGAFAEAEVQAAIGGTVQGINNLLARLGSNATLVGFQAGLETSGKGRGGVFAGGALSTGVAFGESGRGDNYAGTLFETTSTQSPDAETALKNFQEDLLQATVQALQAATDIPKSVQAKLAGINAESLNTEQLTAVLNEIAEFPNLLLQQAGTSRDALVQAFTNGLLTGDAAAAGQAVADQLVGSIEQAMIGGAAGQIFDIVNVGIVTPMLDAILAGQLASEAISQQAIDGVVAKATAAAEALGQVLNDPAFQSAMEGLRTTVSSALGAAGAAINYVPRYQPQYNAAQEAAARAAAQEAERAAEAAARAAAQAAEEAARAAAQYQRALEDAQDYISGISRSISEFLASLDAQAGGLQSYTKAAAAFSTQLVLAQGGDRDALNNITGSAGALVETIRRESNSAAEANLRVGRVRGQLAGLPAQLSPEQFIVDGLSPVITALPAPIVTGIGNALALNANQVSAAVTDGFAVWDANSDGLLTIDEFKAGMAGKASDAELAFWFDKLDQNDDGSISQLELIASRAGGLIAAINDGFTAMDANNNGLLTIDEFRAGMLGKASDAELSYWFDKLDQNGDGSLSQLELIAQRTGIVGFDENDPIRSVWDAIRSANLASNFYLEDHGNKLNAISYYLAQSFFGGGSLKIRGATTEFAKGGVFTNSIVNGPTPFDMGLMGEAGPEAIMPLTRGADGKLGVVAQVQLPNWSQYGRGSDNNAALVAEIRALREEQQAQARAFAQMQQRQVRVLERWDGNGLPEERVVA